jgi:hypothetical protein
VGAAYGGGGYGPYGDGAYEGGGYGPLVPLLVPGGEAYGGGAYGGGGYEYGPYG